jgi:hypothetical protein
MSEPTMMETAQTTPEGIPSSEAPNSPKATADVLYGGQQQASKAQEQQVAEPTNTVKPEATEQAKPEGAPEKYEFKAPEGKQLDAETIKTFSEVAKELNLTQDAAQKMLTAMSDKLGTQQAAQIESVRSQWAESSKSDKEFGGDKITENLSVAKKALDTFGTAELRSLLNDSGLGNHPEVIRFMYRAGKAISEDRYVGSSTGSSNARSNGPMDFAGAAAALYSNQS